jgi:sec-independent protein translocase protein TatA
MGSLSWVHWLVVGIAVLVLFGGRGKISSLMTDFAQGIKAFKKGMSEDDTAKVETPAEPTKTIDAKGDPLKQHAQTERKFEGTTG